MHIARVMIGSFIILGSTSGAMAILADDYVGIRILEPPAVHPPPDCQLFVEENQTCGGGAVYAAGISDAGDVFGTIETNHPHLHHNEEGIRWLRRTGYAGQNMRRYQMAEGTINPDTGLPLSGARAKGLHAKYVSAGGIASGISNVDNAHVYAYDIVNDKWWDFGKGQGMKANSLGHVLAAGSSCCGGPAEGYYSRVNDRALVHEPYTIEERGELQRLGPETQPQAINDDGVIVGGVDPTCIDIPGTNPLCFGSSAAMKIVPTGENEWSDAIRMDELVDSVNSSRAFDLSNTEPSFAVGYSKSDEPFEHGVIWNVDTGQIVADLGPLSRVNRINSTGDMAVGTRTTLAIPPRREAMIWWTQDNWASVDSLSIQEILDVVPGGEDWFEITSVTSSGAEGINPGGINRHGQVLVTGILSPAAPIESLTTWSRQIATGEVCPEPSDWPCGIPFILDTMALETVLGGDVNNDGSVNNLDITPFIAALSAADEAAFLTQFPNGNYDAADIDMSGSANNLDITPFIGLLTAASATAVPEPSSIVCVVLALMMGRRRAVRR